MNTALKRRRHRPLTALGVLSVALVVLLALPLGATSKEEGRIGTGVKLFRSILAADLDLSSKVTEQDQLLLVVFYTDDKARAESLATELRKTAIRDLQVRVETTSDATFGRFDKSRIAGIFLGQAPSNTALSSVIRYAIEHKVIAYSPFEGHVEKGVLGGVSIEAQVKPYVNAVTLQASGINLKPNFLKIAKVYR